MKKTLKPGDLRTFTKLVSDRIKAKKAELEMAFLEDVKKLLSQDSISKEEFASLFSSHTEFVFLEGSSRNRTVRFKKDGTPNLGSLPMNVRKIWKDLQADETNRKTQAINEVLSKETISIEDLANLKVIGKINSLKQKFSSTTA